MKKNRYYKGCYLAEDDRFVVGPHKTEDAAYSAFVRRHKEPPLRILRVTGVHKSGVDVHVVWELED